MYHLTDTMDFTRRVYISFANFTYLGIQKIINSFSQGDFRVRKHFILDKNIVMAENELLAGKSIF